MKQMPISRRKFLETAGAAASVAIVPTQLRATESLLRGPENSRVATVRIATSAAPILFDPDEALGSSMDILSHDVVEKIYTPEMVKQCLSAGWGPITYRQNTELSIGAWHWNPSGAWSDAHNKRGYFTGSAELKDPIRHSYGYPLPHRGTTRNGGSEHGFSRVTDGNAETYWKSNPYLSSKFTGQPDSAHPQWIVVDLGSHEPVSHMRIDWCDPYATRYEVQYWTPDKKGAEENPMERPAFGAWTAFPNGVVDQGRTGSVTLSLCSAPISARFLRIWMTESSNTADRSPNALHDPADQRSGVGYAIREIHIGTLTPNGEFVDLVQHRADQNQTPTFCSSIDPWHSEPDIDTHGDQTGLDLFFTSGITNNLPAMIPISLLYGTPTMPLRK
jgi:F5/8 type C domain-containing protein